MEKKDPTIERTNISLPSTVMLRAKSAAAEKGQKLSSYIEKLIIADTSATPLEELASKYLPNSAPTLQKWAAGLENNAQVDAIVTILYQLQWIARIYPDLHTSEIKLSSPTDEEHERLITAIADDPARYGGFLPTPIVQKKGASKTDSD